MTKIFDTFQNFVPGPVILVASLGAAAQPPQHMPTTTEMMMLPEYCQAKFGSNQALSDQWRQRMGPEQYLHLHHYCHGLNYMRRATFANGRQDRRYALERAVNEFDYVLQRWPANFFLTPQARQQQNLAKSMLLGP